MAKRGRILRDPYAGPGLLMVEGKQYPFLKEELWRSQVPAKAGQVVNVDFDPQGNLNSITAATESEIDREQADVARADSGVRRVAFDWVLGTGSLAQVTAAILLILSWCLLTAVSIRLPFFGKFDLTFWQVLGYLSAGSLSQTFEVSSNPDSGVFGFLAIVVLAGPFLSHLWNDRLAFLGGMLPLTFMLLVAYMIRNNIQGLVLSAPYKSAQTNLYHGVFHEMSVGLGTYLSLSLAVYFAVRGVKQFIAAGRIKETTVEGALPT